MINKETAEKLEKLMEQEDFAAQAEQIEGIEALAELLGKYGVEVTAEELNSVMANANAGDELTAEDMDAVSGGARVPTGMDVLKYICNVLKDAFTTAWNNTFSKH